MPPRPSFCVRALSRSISPILTQPQGPQPSRPPVPAPILTISPHAITEKGPTLSQPAPALEFLLGQPLSSPFFFLSICFPFCDLSNPHIQTALASAVRSVEGRLTQCPRSRKAARGPDETRTSLLVLQLLSGHLPSLKILLSSSISTNVEGLVCSDTIRDPGVGAEVTGPAF